MAAKVTKERKAQVEAAYVCENHTENDSQLAPNATQNPKLQCVLSHISLHKRPHVMVQYQKITRSAGAFLGYKTVLFSKGKKGINRFKND